MLNVLQVGDAERDETAAEPATEDKEQEADEPCQQTVGVLHTGDDRRSAIGTRTVYRRSTQGDHWEDLYTVGNGNGRIDRRVFHRLGLLLLRNGVHLTSIVRSGWKRRVRCFA